MHKDTKNRLIDGWYKTDAFENYIEFSCFTDQILTGMDMHGGSEDVVAVEEAFECGLFENIKAVENLKHAINAEFTKHVAFAKYVFADNIQVQQELNLFGIINFDLNSWIEHVKIFYINLLSDTKIYNAVYKSGLGLDEIEHAIELMIQLEEFIIINSIKEKENWN
jgi:hypothetical protein